MKENFEVMAIRLARAVIAGPRKGWLSDVRKLAEGIMVDVQPEPLPLAHVEVPKPEAKAPPIDAHIRWMIRRDMPEVMEMENLSYPNPWDGDDFIKLLRQRNCIGMVAEVEERVVGFMIFELFKSRIELMNLVVHPDFRWKGVGRQMVNKVRSKLSLERRTRVLLRVRETNLTALLFFKANGFAAIKTERDVYEDSEDDAIVMQVNYVQGEHSIPYPFDSERCD